ncbi:MAG: methyl-accepting chemotaxis protein [Pseudomonadota bacterium]
MLNSLSIKSKLFAGFGCVLAIILGLLLLAYNNFSKLSAASDWDRHTLEVLDQTDQITVSLLQIQTSTRGFMLTGSEAMVGPIDKEKARIGEHLAKAIALTADKPAHQERLKRLPPMIDHWSVNVINPMIEKKRELIRNTGTAQPASLVNDVLGADKAMTTIRAVLAEVTDEERRLLVVRSGDSDALEKSMNLVLSAGGIICIVLSAVIGLVLARALLTPLNNLTFAVGQIAAGQKGVRAAIVSRDELGKVTDEFNRMAQFIEENQANELEASSQLRAKVETLLEVVSKAAVGDLTGSVTVTGADAIGRLGSGLQTMVDNLRKLINNVQKAGIQVTTSATEIAASAKEQEATGIEQAQTSVEILATTKEISANTAQLLKTMEDATAVADYTTSATADAQGNLKRMDLTMQTMVSATDSINAKLAALSEKASNINSVLITITKVADQTNILSLNAAIEAEKAGDAGRGFSVVATEIRRLADQTSVSTWDIEQMLKEMQSAVSASVMGMDKFSEEIRRSVGEVRQVGEQLSSVMDQVQKLAPQFDLVLQGMQSQAVGASQISETMMQLNDATQQTVDSLKATSEAVHQLQYAASDLQSSVATFSVSG